MGTWIIDDVMNEGFKAKAAKSSDEVQEVERQARSRWVITGGGIEVMLELAADFSA
jgi:hypothetical protein